MLRSNQLSKFHRTKLDPSSSNSYLVPSLLGARSSISTRNVLWRWNNGERSIERSSTNAPNHTSQVADGRSRCVYSWFHVARAVYTQYTVRSNGENVGEGFHARRLSGRNLNSRKSKTTRSQPIERRNDVEKGTSTRIHTRGILATPVGYTRIIQTNRNPAGTERVPINFEMSPVKIQARR